MSMGINTSFSRGPGGCIPAHDKGTAKLKAVLTGIQSGSPIRPQSGNASQSAESSPVKQARPALQGDQGGRVRQPQNGGGGIQAPAPAPSPAPVGPGTLLDLTA